MTKYLVDYTIDGFKDFGTIWARSVEEAIAWIKENKNVEPFKVSIRDYSNERNGQELVLWER